METRNFAGETPTRQQTRELSKEIEKCVSNINFDLRKIKGYQQEMLLSTNRYHEEILKGISSLNFNLEKIESNQREILINTNRNHEEILKKKRS